MWRPPSWRTPATAPSSRAPQRMAASRRASPLQSGAVALGDRARRGGGLGSPLTPFCKHWRLALVS